jgi:putative transposase
VFGIISARVRSRVTALVTRVKTALRAALRPASVVGGFIGNATRSHAELLAENMLLRQQLVVAARAVKRPQIRAHERGLFVLLCSLVPRWREALLLVKPETIVRWHREGFRLFWRWRSKRQAAAMSRVGPEVVELIRRMALQNALWGAERIRGELLKLGIRVAKRTVQKYMRGARPPGPHHGQPWLTFLNNHTTWACDFLQLNDLWFRPIFAFFIVELNTRRVVHLAVTRAPSEQWTAQQLREATAFGQAPELLIRDRDDKYGAIFDRVAGGVGIRVLKPAVEAPLMNAVCERFLGGVRRECLDHVIILNERHLARVLREYALDYFNTARPHQGIAQRIPVSRERKSSAGSGSVVSVAVLGGLHHDYSVAA